jgi:ADP-ribosylglycohydrolase
VDQDRILGSLVGLAAGDCLGAPVEGKRPSDIFARFGVLRDFQYDAPIWTDDTQQALVLAEATVRHGVPDPSWVGRRYVEMSHPRGKRRFGCHRGTGRGFRHSVVRFEECQDWRRSGDPERAGNGAAMRIAPVATALRALPDEEFARAITEVSMVTHRELRAIAGALAVGWLAARLSAEPGYPVPNRRGHELLADLVSWVQAREAWLQRAYPELAPHGGDLLDVSTLLRRLFDRWDGGWTAQETEIVDFASARLGAGTFATAGYVLCSVVTSIALVLASSKSLEETVVHAVNLGGDADTVGAMVGGMAGAAAGLSAIPERWLTFDGRPELEAWGRALAARTAGSAPPDPDRLPSLVDLERRLWNKLRGA